MKHIGYRCASHARSACMRSDSKSSISSRLCIWPAILLGLSLTQITARASEHLPLESPVVQASIPGPGEAVAIMAAMQRADKESKQTLLFDVADESSAEIEMTGQDPIPLGLIGLQETPEAELAPFTDTEIEFSSSPPATDQQALLSPEAPALPQQASEEPETIPTAPVEEATPVRPTITDKLDQLAQRRVKGEISGDEYLAERRRIIYGEEAPKPAPVTIQLVQLTVEQKLAALKHKRIRGEVSGDEYLAERKRLINGG